MSNSKIVVMESFRKSKRASILIDETLKSHLALKDGLRNLYRAAPETIADKSAQDILDIVADLVISLAYVDRTPYVRELENQIRSKIIGGVAKPSLTLTGVELKEVFEVVTTFYEKAAEAQTNILQATQLSSALFSHLNKTS